MANGWDEGKEFLGSGIAFPLRLDANGQIAMQSLEAQVAQSIRLILETATGERVMRPDFGADLPGLVFAPMTAATGALAEHKIKEALTRFEPRIDLLNVKATAAPQAGKLTIELSYRVRRTDTMFNLVYPFYLEKGEI